MARRLMGAAGIAHGSVDNLARQIRDWKKGAHFPRDWASAYADEEHQRVPVSGLGMRPRQLDRLFTPPPFVPLAPVARDRWLQTAT
jgi:hypothetical protein